MEATTARVGGYLNTYTGKRFYPLDPRLEEIDINDIAHGLSQLCRFGGQCRTFYSVAQHSVHVAENLPEPLKLWGLLHDASEAYCVDIPRPLKLHLPDYAAIEEQVQRVIAIRFNLQGRLPSEVERVDKAILMDESAALLRLEPGEWDEWGFGPPLGFLFEPWPPAVAERRFLEFFNAYHHGAA